VISEPLKQPASAPPNLSPISTAKPRDTGKPKTTLNLQNIFKEKPASPQEKTIDDTKTENGTAKPLELEQVKKVWRDFAELRKNQIAEYGLLTRDFELQGNQIVLPLSNPVEEPILQGLRTSLIIYLRDKLGHSSINVMGILKEIEGKKMIYTNKDKFDHLAEKNPLLKELQERFGLDPDF
jgi:hypothetical protein